MNYHAYLQLLLANGEKSYADFSQPLSNSGYIVIGIRIPNLRKIIKTNYQDDNLLLTDFELGKYLEVDFSYFAIGLLRCKDVSEQLVFLQQNMQFAQSWMITDMVSSYLKKISFTDFWSYFTKTYCDEHVYVRRFAYVFALKFYRDEKILRILDYLQNDGEYMVYMGQAWLLATMAICYPEAVYDYLQKHASTVLKNKTISKIKESYRINEETKNKFIGLRNSK